jgi:fibronectin type 3 domain-containing protein
MPAPQRVKHWYKVSAIVDGAEGLLSGQIPASTSSIPDNVRVTAETAKSVSLAWNTVSEASGYNVYRSDSENGIYNQINIGAVTGTGFTDTGLSQDAAYWYKVSAIIDGAEGLLSGQIPASTSSVPGNMRVTVETAKSVSLAWNVVFEASGYNVYRSDSENGIYNQINTGTVTGAEFTDTGLSQDVTYWYKVSAIIDGAEGLLSGQIPASTSSVPGNVRVTAETANSVSLAWNVVSEASGYNVYRSDSENGTYNRINTGTVTFTAFTDTNVSTAYATYFYKVSAVINGIEGIQSSPVSAGTDVMMVPGNSFAAKLDWLKNNATSNFLYLIEIDADTSVVPQILSYSEKNGITIILRGNGKACSLNLSVSGSLFTIDSGVTLILDNNITLNGRTNNTSLVRINNGGTLIMNEGSKITGNTVYGSSAYGGGVYIYGGTFIMNGGKITGNNVSSSLSNYDYSAYVYGGGVYINTGVFTMNAGEISGNNINVRFDTNTITNSGRAYGAGVYIANGIFNMNGGEIFSNTATATTYNGNTSIFGEGGGVYVTSGSVKFRMSGGVIYGSNAAGGLANGTTFGRALYCGAGTAQYGTVDDNTFYRSGDFGTSTNTTIRIVNGNLLTE